MKDRIYLIAGYVCLALAITGILLPVVPGAPFIILAGFCFSRGSPRMHKYLLNHKLSGRVLTDWEKYGILRPMTKLACCSFFLISFAYMIFLLKLRIEFLFPVGVVFALACAYFITRPSSREDSRRIIQN